MSKTLGQNDIDALFTKMQASRTAGGAHPAKKIVPFDLRRSSQLTTDQIAALTTLHESFARRISNSLGAHLRVGFEMTLVSVEQLTFREFSGRVPDLSYLGLMHVMPIDAHAVVQIDIALAFPMIDVVLGGSGSLTMDARDLTEIEEQILDSVFRLIMQDMHQTWAPVMDLDFQFEQRQRNVQMQSSMLPGEKVLCLTFEAHLLETSGAFTIVFPAVVANTLLRRLSARWSHSERLPSRNMRRRLHDLILDGRFLLDLSLPGRKFSVRQLINMMPGEVVVLDHRVSEPVHLNVAGKPMFLAQPARAGSNRAARVVKRVPLFPLGTKRPE